MSKVDHPAHYNRGNIEVISLIKAFFDVFDLGNTVKYICRAQDKHGLEDLEKALWYLEYHLDKAPPGVINLAEFLQQQNLPNPLADVLIDMFFGVSIPDRQRLVDARTKLKGYIEQTKELKKEENK